MRALHDEFDEFVFGDSDMVQKIMREQEREERRLASRRRRTATAKYRFEPVDEIDDFSDLDSFEETDFSDYNEDEFDRYSGLEF